MSISKSYYYLLLSITFTFSNCFHFEKKELKIGIQPFKGVEMEHVKVVQKALEKYYNAKTVILEEKDLIPTAFYKPLNKYQADSLIAFLRDNKASEFDKIIGITNKDISTTKNNIQYYGIFGLAFLEGQSCVISSFRLKRKSTKAEQFNLRFSKVALHEVGHTLGLEHCTNSDKCFMHSAEGKLSTVDKEELKLCSICAEKINNYLKD